MKYTHEDNNINKYLNKRVYIMFNDNTFYSGILQKNNNRYKIICYDKDVVFYKSHIKAIYRNGEKIYKG